MVTNRTNEHQLERQIMLSEAWDTEQAIIEARAFAARTGFDPTDQAMIATAAAELATNVLRYAGKGELTLRILKKDDRIGIEIVAVDKGPGIQDVEMAMEEKFTTTTGSLGLGLPSIKRIMDDLVIESSRQTGTRITARKWRKRGKY